jgi:SAM-dependent methyltransferase
MKDEPWQLRLFKKSIKKKQKVRLLERSVAFDPDRTALDLGCAQGMLSYFARQKGGFWVSADEDQSNLRAARDLLEKDLVRLRGDALPFPDRTFDLVLCLDYLEHIDNDDGAVEEMARVLRPNGQVILVTPHTGPFYIFHKLRAALGLKLEFFGHKREGYSLPGLEAKLQRARLRLENRAYYSRTFSEFFELILNFIYIKILSSRPAEKKRDGHIRPSTGEEFSVQKKPFTLYTLVYPAVWLFSRLDTLLFFQKGYSLMVWARKE